MPKILAKLKQGQSTNGGAKCRLGRLKFATFDKTRYNSKTSTVASVLNLVQSQVYHTEVHLCLQHVCRDAATADRPICYGRRME